MYIIEDLCALIFICNLWALICVNTCACSMCFVAGFMSLFAGFDLLEVLVYLQEVSDCWVFAWF